jgi:hypothetical protein
MNVGFVVGTFLYFSLSEANAPAASYEQNRSQNPAQEKRSNRPEQPYQMVRQPCIAPREDEQHIVWEQDNSLRHDEGFYKEENGQHDRSRNNISSFLDVARVRRFGN